MLLNGVYDCALATRMRLRMKVLHAICMSTNLQMFLLSVPLALA